MKRNRKIYLVDKQVQLHVAGRVIVYWCSALLFVLLPLALLRTVQVGGTFPMNILVVCQQYWQVFTMLFLFLPFAIYDSIRVSNQYAGPIYRLREELRKREEGKKIGPITFREGDHYTDLPQSINMLIEQVDSLEAIVEKELQSEAI